MDRIYCNEGEFFPYKRSQGNTEIFIGQHAGESLLDSMNNATNEILVVSPYVSYDYVNELVRLANRGVRVYPFITSQMCKKDERNILRLLIQRRVDRGQHYLLRRIAGLVLAIIGGLCAFLSAVWFCYDPTQQHFMILFFSMVGAILGAGLSKRRFIYSESLKFYYGNKGSFIHSKIYIVDGKFISYGSANFTRRGVDHNIETLITHFDENEATSVRDWWLKKFSGTDWLSQSSTPWWQIKKAY